MRFKYFATAIAAITLAGCSNNDDVPAGNNEIANEEGKSYLSISLVTDGSAISRGESGGYEEGNDNDENGVNSVGFIFFDANGDNHSHVLYTINNGTTSIDNDNRSESIADLGDGDGFNFKDDDEDSNNTPGTDNIEKISDAVIVFKNLKNNSTPRSVLALLNVSADDFKTIKNQDLSELLLSNNKDKTGTKFKNENDFIMSNSAYVDGNKDVTSTAISASDFKTDEAAAKKSPVSIYVERMAAKVQLTRTSNPKQEINLPVQTGEGATSVTDTKLTIEVVAWGLSGMNKDSYWFKNVDASWNYSWGKNNSWNNANDHRSYWAKDTNYDTGSYVVDNASITDSNKEKLSLIYKAWSDYTGDAKLEVGKSTYCYENTFSGALDTQKSTNVLVLAKFKKNNSDLGENVTWYKYNGVLYDETNYKKAALQYFADNTDIRVKTTNETTTEYNTLTENDVTVSASYKSDGYSVLGAIIASGKTLVKHGESGDTNVSEVDLNKALAEFTKATSYKNGMMYYCIPIQHLNTHAENHSTAENSDDCTGEYGVVRNHWYQLEVGNITALGKGVYDPTELIVPNDEENQFFLAAKLHILSWHIVKQTISDLDKPMM